MIELSAQEKAEILSKCKNQYHIDWITRCFERPIEQITMAYHLKRNNGVKYGDQLFIYYLHAGAASWIHKKGNTLELARRLATRDECIDAHLASRFKFMIYEDWEKLIEDDALVGDIDRAFIQKLRDLSKQHTLRKKN